MWFHNDKPSEVWSGPRAGNMGLEQILARKDMQGRIFGRKDGGNMGAHITLIEFRSGGLWVAGPGITESNLGLIPT